MRQSTHRVQTHGPRERANKATQFRLAQYLLHEEALAAEDDTVLGPANGHAPEGVGCDIGFDMMHTEIDVRVQRGHTEAMHILARLRQMFNRWLIHAFKDREPYLITDPFEGTHLGGFGEHSIFDIRSQLDRRVSTVTNSRPP